MQIWKNERKRGGKEKKYVTKWSYSCIIALNDKVFDSETLLVEVWRSERKMAGRKDIYVAKWFLFMFHSSGQLTINLALLVLACVKAWLLALKDVRFSAPGTLETSRVKV